MGRSTRPPSATADGGQLRLNHLLPITAITLMLSEVIDKKAVFRYKQPSHQINGGYV